MASFTLRISVFSLHLLVAVLLSIVISSHSVWYGREQAARNEICSKTQNHTFCSETLSLNDIYVDFDGYVVYKGITRVAIDKAREYTNQTSSQINTALLVGNQIALTTRHHQYMQCSKIYKDAIGCLEKISGFMDGIDPKYESAKAKAVELQKKGKECDRVLGTMTVDPLELHLKNLKLVDYGGLVWASIDTQLRHSRDIHLIRKG